MDPQLVQQLMQIFQQGLQILQSAGGAQDQGMNDMDMDDDGDMEYGNDSDFDQDNGDDDEMPGYNKMGGMPARKTLNDRVKMLESHTGLMRKSADATLSSRIDDLEDSILGEQYEGTAVQRVQQLEEAVGIENLSKAATNDDDDAPDVIDLGALIKTAIDEGIQRGLAATQSPQSESEGLPSPGAMRKAAKGNGGVKYGSRKAQRTTLQTDPDLVKAAQQFGYSEEELDQPVGLGDLLLMEYTASKAGQSMFSDDED